MFFLVVRAVCGFLVNIVFLLLKLLLAGALKDSGSAGLIGSQGLVRLTPESAFII